MFEDAGDGTMTIGGLGYIVPGRSMDGLVKPMSPDDKLKNGIFNGMCKKAWIACMQEAESNLNSECGEIGRASGDALAEIMRKREHTCLSRGLYKLSQMAEDDKEAAAKKIKSEKDSRMDAGKQGHLRWLERKDATRIKLPPEGTFKEESKGKFDCGKYNAESFRIVKQKGPEPINSATVVRRMGIGLKTGYAHATGEGLSADMKLARKSLLKEGFVHIENFTNPEEGALIDEEARAKYIDELAKNKAVYQQKNGEADKRAKSDRAFKDWTATKEAAELAVECMQLLPVVLDFEARPSNNTSGNGSVASTPTKPGSVSEISSMGTTTIAGGFNKPLLNRPPTADEYELWRAVGYACKAIDRALLTPWMVWSAPLFGKQDCLSEWDSFKPLQDTNSADTKAKDNQNETNDIEHERSHSPYQRTHAMQENKSPERGPSSPKKSHNVPLALYKPPKIATAEKWTADDREAGLRLLRMLSDEHRRLAAFRNEAANEKPPAMPLLRRELPAEALPAFLHGHEGSVRRIQNDLAIVDGLGLGMLGGTGVGSELVMQWFVGEDDVRLDPALGKAAFVGANNDENNGTDGPTTATGKAPENPDDLLKRLNSAHSKTKNGKSKLPHQPPYVVVLETCGIAGGKSQRDGNWTRVLIDPPEPLPILSSAPGSSYIPISARAQGMGLLPPLPGEQNELWERDSQRLRGCVRLTGLIPNTTYCYRIRAFSRAGASPYSFGAFTTAAAPPPAPILALPFLAPRPLLSISAINISPEGVMETLPTATSPDSLFLIWERRVDFRVHLLRLLRVFYACTLHNRRNSTKMLENGSSKSRPMREDADGIKEYIDEIPDDDHPSDDNDASGGLFSSIKASRQTMLVAINRERGLYNWLASCVANADLWPMKTESDDAAPTDHDEGSTFRRLPARFRIANTRPATVLEVFLTDSREFLMWSDILNMFGDDAESDDPLDLMLAGTSLASAGTSVDDDSFSVTARPRFAGGAGHMSIDSQRRALLRQSQTLSRLNSQKLSSTISRPLTAAAATMTMKQTLNGTSRPVSASGTKSGIQDSGNRSVAGSGITRMLDGLGRRNSIGGGSTTGMSVKLAQPVSDRGVRYSLLQCVSDGPRGQEWQEIYLGARSTRRVDKLLPGTSYTFKVQSINGDNQGSLYSPQGYVTTAFPCVTNLRTLGKLQATSVTVTWEPVSAANALTTMRAISMGSSDTGDDGNNEEGKDKPKSANPAAAADIDAVLQALLQRTKGSAASDADKKKSGKKLLASATSMVPIREGDGGVGVDITRVWEKYDREGTGFIDSFNLRGLLTDLGAYSETTALVTGADTLLPAASLEGAASSGPADWRVAAALSILDPRNTGRINQTEFADWWNSVDAALEKALAVKSSSSSVASRSRPQSAHSSVTGHMGIHNSIVDPAAMGSPGATLENLGSAVIYVLECRRRLTKDEIASMNASQNLNTTVDGIEFSHTNRSHRMNATGGSVASGGRPSSATRTALNAPTTAGIVPLPPSAFEQHVTPWTVVYMGPTNRFRVTDLLPNGDYQFRVTVVGRHAYSVPSLTLNVILPPLAPFAPVVIKTYPRSAAVRWYPGELNADKFEVQVKLLESLLPSSATVHGKTDRLFAGSGKLYTGRNISEAAKRRLATSRAISSAGSSHPAEEEQELWQEDPDSNGWISLYTGSNTYTMLTGLIGNSVYRVRVIGYNTAGVPSHPSVETQMVTTDTHGNEPLSVSNAGRYFVVECGAANADIPSITDHGVPPLGTLPAQDMVVGDVILFTEDVYVDATPDPDPYHPAQKKEVPESSPRAHFLCSRTIAATVIGDTCSHVNQGTGNSANVGSPGGPVPIGSAAKAFIANEAANSVVQSEETRLIMTGKKLVSVHSFKAGQRPPTASRRHSVSGDDKNQSINRLPAPETIAQAVEQRVLSLQVEWCTVSLARAGPYVVPHGAILKRKQSEMAHLDIYRCMWEDESGRWSLGEELRASFSQ